eukprot:gene12385-8509_t
MTVRTAAWATDMLSSLPAVVTAAVGFLLGWSEARLPVQPPFSRLGEVRLVQMAAAAAADPGLAPGPVPWDPTTNDATQKDDSSLRLWEVSRQDYAHAPVPYALALQSLAGLRLNTVTGRGVEMRASERRALRQHLGPHAADLSPGGAGGADAPAAPQKRLQGFIQGDHLHYTFGIGEITDQHASKSAIPPEELRTATRRFVLTTLEEDGTAAISFFTHPEIRKHRNVNLTYLLEHPLLAHWYAVNGNVQHPKFTALPIGMLFYHNSGRHLLNKGLSTSRYAEEEMEREVTRVFLQQMDLNQIFPHIAHPLKLGRAGCLWVEKAMDIFRIDDEWQGERSGPPRSVHPTWVPISELPATVTTIYVVLMPIYLASEPDSGFHPPPPSLTHHVLVFPPTASRVDDPTDKKEASDEWDSWSLPLAHSFSPPSSLPSPTVPLRATVAFLPFTAAVLHRLRQVPYGDSSKKHSVAVGFQRYAWRDRWLHYLTSHPELVVHPKTKEKLSYYTLLSDTAFTAAPVGYGYECYRYWEALILGSIPLLDNPVTAVRKIKGNTFRNPIASSAELAFPGDLPKKSSKRNISIEKSSVQLELLLWPSSDRFDLDIEVWRICLSSYVDRRESERRGREFVSYRSTSTTNTKEVAVCGCGGCSFSLHSAPLIRATYDASGHVVVRPLLDASGVASAAGATTGATPSWYTDTHRDRRVGSSALCEESSVLFMPCERSLCFVSHCPHNNSSSSPLASHTDSRFFSIVPIHTEWLAETIAAVSRSFERTMRGSEASPGSGAAALRCPARAVHRHTAQAPEEQQQRLLLSRMLHSIEKGDHGDAARALEAAALVVVQPVLSSPQHQQQRQRSLPSARHPPRGDDAAATGVQFSFQPIVRAAPCEARSVVVLALRLYARLGQMQKIRAVFTAALRDLDQRPPSTSSTPAQERTATAGGGAGALFCLLNVHVFNAYLEVLTLRRMFDPEEARLVLEAMQRRSIAPNALTIHYLVELQIRAGYHPMGVWNDATRGFYRRMAHHHHHTQQHCSREQELEQEVACAPSTSLPSVRLSSLLAVAPLYATRSDAHQRSGTPSWGSGGGGGKALPCLSLSSRAASYTSFYQPYRSSALPPGATATAAASSSVCLDPLPATLQALLHRVVPASAAAITATAASQPSGAGPGPRAVYAAHAAFAVEVTRAALRCGGGGSGYAIDAAASSSGGEGGAPHVLRKRQLVELVECWLLASTGAAVSTAAAFPLAASAGADDAASAGTPTAQPSSSSSSTSSSSSSSSSGSGSAAAGGGAVTNGIYPPEYILWLLLELELRCVLDRTNFGQFIQKRHVVALLLCAARCGDASTTTQILALMDRHLMKKTGDTGALAVWCYSQALQLEQAMEMITWMAHKGYLELPSSSIYQRYTTVDTLHYTMDRHYLMTFVDALYRRERIERALLYLQQRHVHYTARDHPPSTQQQQQPQQEVSRSRTTAADNNGAPSTLNKTDAAASLVSSHLLDLLVLAYAKLGYVAEALALVQSYEPVWGVSPLTHTLNALLMGLQLSTASASTAVSLATKGGGGGRTSGAAALLPSSSSSSSSSSASGSLYHRDVFLRLTQLYPTVVPNALTYKLLIRQAIACDNIDEAVEYLQVVGGGGSSGAAGALPGPAGPLRVEVEMILPIMERAARAGDADTVRLLSQFALDCDIGIDAAVLQTVTAHLAKAGQSVEVLRGHRPLHEALRSRSKTGRQRAKSTPIKL